MVSYKGRRHNNININFSMIFLVHDLSVFHDINIITWKISQYNQIPVYCMQSTNSYCILFPLQLVLIAYGGVAIATMTRLDTDPTDSVYYEYDYEEDTPYVYPFLILVVLIASLCCTVGSLLCDIPVLIIQFTTTNKVMNSVTFRTLVCSIHSQAYSSV